MGIAPLDVGFASTSTGWVGAGNRILATVDGGKRWRVQFRTARSADLHSIDVLDVAHAWALGDDAIVATSDGGRHWRRLAEPCPVLRSVAFITRSIGYGIAVRSPTAQTGGRLLRTTDGGRTWRGISSPADVQSVCFADLRHGWLGADGSVYGTRDGGSNWHRQLAGYLPHGLKARVGCTAGGAAWAELSGGGAMNQQTHIAYHQLRRGWVPIFAEQFFPHPTVHVTTASPGSYSGPFSVLDHRRAVFVDYDPAGGFHGPHPRGVIPIAAASVAVAIDGGRRLIHRPDIQDITDPAAVDFVTASQGWAVGTYQEIGRSGREREPERIAHTNDGGRSWHTQYRLGRR